MNQLLSRLKTTLSSNESGSDIDAATCYSILDNRRRRIIVEFLDEHEDDVVSLRDIADHVAAETDVERQTCYIAVLQEHAPKLDAEGVATYDSQAQRLLIHAELERVYEAHRAVQDTLSR